MDNGKELIPFYRSRMLILLKKGSTPIEVSITKWKNVLAYMEEGNYVQAALVGISSKNCALCYKYGRERYRSCHGCPIAEATHVSNCTGTSYNDFTAGFVDGRNGLMKQAAENMLSLLEDIKVNQACKKASSF